METDLEETDQKAKQPNKCAVFMVKKTYFYFHPHDLAYYKLF